MKRDMDLIRDILLKIEGGQRMFETLSSDEARLLEIPVETPMSREEASSDEAWSGPKPDSVYDTIILGDDHSAAKPKPCGGPLRHLAGRIKKWSAKHAAHVVRVVTTQCNRIAAGSQAILQRHVPLEAIIVQPPQILNLALCDLHSIDI